MPFHCEAISAGQLWNARSIADSLCLLDGIVCQLELREADGKQSLFSNGNSLLESLENGSLHKRPIGGPRKTHCLKDRFYF